MALNILSGMSYNDFIDAVDAEEVALLTRIPGLGKKTANRIVLELRGKLPRDGSPADALYGDTISALVNLGYKKAEAAEAIEMARKKGHEDVESLLREALKCLKGD